MKNACVCVVVLLLVGNGVSQGWDDFFKDTSEGKIASWKEEFKAPENLRNALKKNLTSLRSVYPFHSISDFKKRFDVKDEDIRTALAEVYRELAHKLASTTREENPSFDSDAHGCSQAVYCMGDFADEPMKRFLLGLAMDNTALMAPRGAAVGAYLRCADVQEVKEFCVSIFFCEKQRYPDYVRDAVMTYMPYEKEGEDGRKREVVLATLYVVAAQAEDWAQFKRLDGFLRAREDKDYLTSHQRLALLKRHSASEPEPEPMVHPPNMNATPTVSLKERLSYMQGKTESFTSISTNLTELMARDFTKPPEKPKDRATASRLAAEEPAITNVATASLSLMDDDPQRLEAVATIDTPPSRLWLYALIPLFLCAGTALWLIRKKR